MTKSEKQILLVGGGIGVAYVLWKMSNAKTVTPVTIPTAQKALPPSTTNSSSLLTEGLSFLQSIVNPSAAANAKAISDSANDNAPKAYTAGEDTTILPPDDVNYADAEGGILQTKAPTLTFAMNGIGTTATTGAAIQKIAPALAAIPVVGWVAAAAGEVIGFALATFGNKWKLNNEIRWLVSFYEYYVLGASNATTDNKVNEADFEPAIKWFSLVLGVPVMDRAALAYLQGVDETNWNPRNYSDDKKANDYLATASAKSGHVTYDQAMQAVQLAKQLQHRDATGTKMAAPGSWSQLTAAPSLVSGAADTSLINPSALNSQSTLQSSAAMVPATSTGITIPGLGVTVSPLGLLAAGAGVILLLSSGKKSKKVSGIEYEKYIVPVGVVVGGALLYNKIFGKNGPLPTNATQDNNTGIASGAAKAAADSIAKLTGAGGAGTMTAAQYQGYADTIYTTGILHESPLTDDHQSTIKWALISANNTLDVLYIIQAFGTKQVNATDSLWSLCNLFGYHCDTVDLPTFLHLVLSSDNIAYVNSWYSSLAINYQF